MKQEYKYAHIAFQKEGNDMVSIFYSVGYPEMPMKVDLENFMMDVRITESIGLVGQPFEVGLLNIRDDRETMQLLHLIK